MTFKNSLLGPMLPAEAVIAENHPMTSNDVKFYDQSFEKFAINIGVSKESLDMDRTLKVGVDIHNMPKPDTQEVIPFEMDNNALSSDDGFDISGLDL